MSTKYIYTSQQQQKYVRQSTHYNIQKLKISPQSKQLGEAWSGWDNDIAIANLCSIQNRQIALGCYTVKAINYVNRLNACI